MKNYYEAPTMKLIVLEGENDVIKTSNPSGMTEGGSTVNGGETDFGWKTP